jgi:AcrR family transcriptional regulator
MPRAGIDSEAIVAAAATVADADGLEAVSLARVAESLGVRSPSLYAHVDGIDDVVRRLGARGLEELAVALSRAVEGRSGGDALRALATAYRSYALGHPGSYAASQRSSTLAHDERAQAAGAAVVRIAVATLRGYGLEGDDAIHAVRVIRSALHGFVALEASGGFAMAQAVDETFDRLVALLDVAFRGSAVAS